MDAGEDLDHISTDASCRTLMRVYLDENMPPQIAAIARAQGLDAVSGHELGHRGFPDDDVLRLAALDRRCVVTRNRDDFVRLTLLFFENEWPHAGVLIVPNSFPHDQFARIARALVGYAGDWENDLPHYTIDFLPHHEG